MSEGHRTAHQGRSGRSGDATVDAVVHRLALDLVDSTTGTTVPLPVDLTYDVRDPWAVALVFATAGGPIRWDFSRELLAEGMYDVAGDGDVHLWPCLDTEARAVVMIELEGADGTLVELMARSRDVAGFLAETNAVVPPGTEGTRVDLDALVEELLAGS